jgi:hypothetical protein
LMASNSEGYRETSVPAAEAPDVPTTRPATTAFSTSDPLPAS